MVHEELKKQYQEDCQNYEKPWELWEFQDFRGKWVTCADSPKFSRLAHYRRKELPFQHECFSGINREDAKGLIGKKVECSNNGQTWCGPFELRIVTIGISSFQANCGWWVYIRTCPETFQDPHPTIRITVNGKDYDLPKPEKEAPKYNTLFYVFCPGAKDMFLETVWRGTDSDHRRLRQGSVFLTEDRAQAWTNWWKEIHRG
jgi:hypothetical protein